MLQNRIQAVREARRNGEGGFTLIELLIVIVVLGILAGMVVFGVGTFRADATTAACRADVKTANVALSAYNAKNATALTGTASAQLTALEGANYIETVPTIPGLALDADGKFTGTC